MSTQEELEPEGKIQTKGIAFDQTKDNLVLSKPKTQEHVMLTQMNIKDELRAYGPKA